MKHQPEAAELEAKKFSHQGYNVRAFCGGDVEGLSFCGGVQPQTAKARLRGSNRVRKRNSGSRIRKWLIIYGFFLV
jgi:hypothetical protein